MWDPYKLLAASVFTDPLANENVKNGTLTELPYIPIDRYGINGQPMLPAQFELAGFDKNEPGTWPMLQPFYFPASPFTWVGDDHHYPQPPTSDPFYWPNISIYWDMANGELIDFRPVDVRAVMPEVRRAWQISYRSEFAEGAPTADVATILIPENYNGRHLLCYAPYQDSVNFDCSPSYAYLTGLRDPSVDALLIQGWAVVMPDHQGKRNSFGSGYRSGKSVLDSIRATIEAQEYLPFSFEKIAMTGYSGGAIAIGYASELQSEYAPELDICGSAFGGVIVDLNATLSVINKGLFSAYALGGFYGLAQECQIMDILEASLKDNAKTRANEIQNHCLIWDVLDYVGQDIFAYFKDGPAVLNQDDFRRVLERERMGFNTPSMPLFIYQADSDEIAPAEKVNGLVDFYCQNGARVDYHMDSQIGHLLEAVAATPALIKFLHKCFEENYVPDLYPDHIASIQANAMDVPLMDDIDAISRKAYNFWKGLGLPYIPL
ncbi:Lipase A [Wickerhamiella sorbophila]|uniref:Lipase A n=1 Tax=Wickerhamiella sorbophila TaxID=45607 RepID=A0A2T0FFH4_9ASCO|nr:Lipase A [Wickerhamiella sorbophila]PRT53738.1 Lipase A [Wickerhamiella sorbophila]